MRDLLVAGGGPAGLGTALYAARAGLDVEVLEPRAGTIDKACGEGLMPGAVAALRDLDVHPHGMDLDGIRYLAGQRSAQAAFRGGAGRGVRRTTLHAALSAAVAEAGVRVTRRPVTSIVQDRDRVWVDGVPSRYLVAADGLHSPVRRRLGLAAPTTTLRRYGLRSHFAVPPWTSHVEVYWSRWAEAYVTPVAPDLVGVALLTTTRQPFADQLHAFPRLRERVGGDTGSPVRGAGPLRQRARRRVAGRVLLVGDASGYVDALTGEGIALGLAQARAAVDAIAADAPQRYERAWRRVTWRYSLLTNALLRASRRPAVRRALVPAAATAPILFGAVVNELGRPSGRSGAR